MNAWYIPEHYLQHTGWLHVDVHERCDATETCCADPVVARCMAMGDHARGIAACLANAKMIAALPDLYHVAFLLASIHTPYWDTQNIDGCSREQTIAHLLDALKSIHIQAKAAIAKAKGEC